VKALTLTPPWGTLIACGEKAVETRSWRTSHRGLLAIHQAQGLAGMTKRDLEYLVESEPFASALSPHLSGYTAAERAANLPRGAIVAVVEVIDCLPVGADGHPRGDFVDDRERAFGNYAHGRWAWMLRHRITYPDGIPCAGARGLWTVPDSVVAALDLPEHILRQIRDER
jgi:hypothetical protein